MKSLTIMAAIGIAFRIDAIAQGPNGQFPPHDKILEGFTEAPTPKNEKGLMSLWVNAKEGQIYAAFNQKFMNHRYFIGKTIGSGENYAGLQAGEHYGYWKTFNKRIAFIEPNLAVRSTGDRESRSSVGNIFTDRVLFDVPIVTMLPQWGPVIDIDDLFVGQASRFFGSSVAGINRNLATIHVASSFPENVEIAFEVPVSGGRLKQIHYSISALAPKPNYTPRNADHRIGYFTTTYRDLGKYTDDETTVRYINRWRLEKADPSLSLSPVKEPIVFYIEHTAPIRYRRWIREGILMWNKAFEKVGFADAIEVRYQDASTQQYMDLHPEDVRYNFVRWLNNDIGTAIGPSRVDPRTGQILDADIILTDGWIRHFWDQYHQQLPKILTEGFSPETYAWLETRPDWDPRALLAPPSQRNHLIAQRQIAGAQPHGGHPFSKADPDLIGDDPYDGLNGSVSQMNGFCQAADCRALDVAMMRFHLAALASQEDDDQDPSDGDGDGEENSGREEKEADLLDGIPEWFIGPLLADLVAHEVGHTLGLRHNFKASSVYTYEEINSESMKGTTAFAGSVMDYLPVNMLADTNKGKQGDFAMIDVGPYDFWAIEYGYTPDGNPKNLKKILSRVAEPELAYATDEDTSGPDPFARRYDFGKNPLSYAEDQMQLAKYHRERIIEDFVKDGDSWAKAREGYELTLMAQSRSLSMMANWLGGAFVYRDRKGDPEGRKPIVAVPAKDQRDALRFVLQNTFSDESFGLTPELLQYMRLDKWYDASDGFQDATWPIHDRISGIQRSVLTALLNPTTLARVFDNEYMDTSEDVLTLPEVMNRINNAIMSELDEEIVKEYTTRSPFISSLRRNLQSDFIDRLIDLSLPGGASGAAAKPIADLSRMALRRNLAKIETLTEDDRLDAYSEAHLSEAAAVIAKALDADYVYNADDLSGGGLGGFLIFGQPNQE